LRETSYPQKTTTYSLFNFALKLAGPKARKLHLKEENRVSNPVRQIQQNFNVAYAFVQLARNIFGEKICTKIVSFKGTM